MTEPKEGITLNARTITLLAAMLGGGVLGGGGLSLASNPADEVRQLSDEVEKLGQQVNTVALAIADMKAEVKADRRDIGHLQKQLDDHESRLRGLEGGD